VPACTWRGIKARGHVPDKQAALKCPCLVTRSLDPTACLEDLATYRETGDQYRESIALKESSQGPGRAAGPAPAGYAWSRRQLRPAARSRWSSCVGAV